MTTLNERHWRSMSSDQRCRNSQGRALDLLRYRPVGWCGRSAAECALLKDWRAAPCDNGQAGLRNGVH